MGNQLFWLLNVSETTLSLLSTKGDLTWKKLHFHNSFQMSQHRCTKDDGSQVAQWAGHHVQSHLQNHLPVANPLKRQPHTQDERASTRCPSERQTECKLKEVAPLLFLIIGHGGLESLREWLGWIHWSLHQTFLWLYPFFPLRRGPIAPKKHCMAVFYNHCPRWLSAVMDMCVVQTCDQQQHVTIKGYSDLFYFN